MSSHALVTGANGLVGRHLMARLQAEDTRRSVVLRAPVDTDWRFGDLVRVHGSLDLQHQDLAGVDTIYHLAGLAHAGAQAASEAQFQTINVDKTLALYRAAVAAEVSHFVWLSSIKVLGGYSETPLTPSDEPAPTDAYAQSKARAEAALLAEPSGVTHLSIVRPPLVYGAGVSANFLALTGYALSGWPLPFARATAPRAWISADNLVDLLVSIPHTEIPSGRIWHARDNEELSVAEMLQALAQAGGARLRLFPVPPGFALSVGSLLGFRERVQRLFLPLQVDDRLTRDGLAWQPPHGQTQELAKVVAWYRQR